MKHLVSVLIFILGLAAVVTAQDAKPQAETPTPQSEFGKRLDDYIKESQQKNAETSPANGMGGAVPPEAELFLIMERLEKLDPPTKAKVLASFDEYLNYRISGYQHRRDVFKWQLFSSRIIFYVVILLVLTGVYFSGIQFHRSIARKRAAKIETGEEVAQVLSAERPDVSEITASIQGIRVSSPVLGVLILVISLAFFYLYLRYVYPIQEIL